MQERTFGRQQGQSFCLVLPGGQRVWVELVRTRSGYAQLRVEYPDVVTLRYYSGFLDRDALEGRVEADGV